MNRLVNALAVAGFALITIGSSTEAHAGFVRVRVDNYNNPVYENAKSTGTLTVCVEIFNDNMPRRCLSKVLEVVGNWDFDFFPPGVLSPVNVTKVELRFNTPGDITDLLVVDQVEIINNTGAVVRTSGVDNSTGNCFSSQVGDFSNVHCNGSAHVLSPANMWVWRP